MPTNPTTKKMRDVLTKDGWRYDEKKEFWTRLKRKGHIKITSEGWIHEVPDFHSLPSGVEKKGFSEKDLQEYLNSLESLDTQRFPLA